MDNLKNLKIYKERCFINSLLFEQALSHNIFLRNIINIPLILISGILTILNSIIEDQNDMKVCNIILNGTVGLILSIINNFKINDKIVIYKNQKNKMIKLQHKIDNYLNTYIDISIKDVEDIINSYDAIIEEVEYELPSFIKKRIKKKFNKFNLPLSLLSTDDCSNELCCITRPESETINNTNNINEITIV